MKKRITALALAFVMVLGTVAVAAGTEKTISVTPMGMTINGQTVTPLKSDGTPAEVFAYDGATYVPLRYLSELLGITVEWDKNDPNTAKLVSDKITLPSGGGDGVYTGTGSGFGGEITATVTVAGGKITACTLTGTGETPAIGGAALPKLEEQVIAAGSAAIDGVSGATMTSKGVKEAVQAALNAAKGVTVGAMSYKAGTYSATVAGMHGPMTVKVTVGSDKIADVEVVDNVETPGLINWPSRLIPERIVASQSLAVDTVTGVTVSSRAILNGVETALTNAGMDVTPLKQPIQKEKAADAEYTADVIVVGGGGAGLSAAVSATEAGASVIVVEKTGFLGGNSIMVGGIYNCADPSRQDYATFPGNPNSLVEDALAEKPVSKEHKALQDAIRKEYEAFKNTDKTLFDSPNWHALQTWNGGDKIASLAHLKVLTENALPTLQWLESRGMKFSDTITTGAGALYPRTHVAMTPNGTGFFMVFEGVLAERGELYTPLMETEAKSLIVENGKVVGVNAVGKDGNKVTLHANKGVVLATGGFAGNVELRQKYCQGEKWPDLGPNLITTNMPGVTGDGIFMAEAVGAELINMEQMQLLPFCNPQTGATFDIASVDCFVNKEGKRFVREDGRRDEMSKAILEQTDGMMYTVFSTDDPSTTYSMGKSTVQYYVDNNLYGYVLAESIEELAGKIGVPADALKQTVADFNAHVESGEKDEFGRVTYTKKIEGKYYCATSRRPAAHHTMGGVNVDTSTHALKADGSVIPGLYCAGEITGNVHGGNRLGGNAVVDFCVFGRIAGTNAASGK